MVGDAPHELATKIAVSEGGKGFLLKGVRRSLTRDLCLLDEDTKSLFVDRLAVGKHGLRMELASSLLDKRLCILTESQLRTGGDVDMGDGL